MRKPTVSPVIGAAIIGAILVAVGLAALGGLQSAASTADASTRPSSTVALPSATPRPANVISIDPAVCPLDRQPGPDETPVRELDGGGDGGGGDSQGFDPIDWGTGRWRLCLTEPAALALEGSAWCQWSADRNEVIGIDGLKLADGDTTLSASWSVPGGFVSLVSVEQEVTTMVWSFGAEVAQPIDPGANGRAGAVTIALAPVPDDHEALPSGVTAPPEPGKAIGTIRWSCGEPPAQRPGWAAGQMTLHLDAPINADWTVPAVCSWVVGRTGPRVDEVTAVSLALGDLDLQIALHLNALFPEANEATLTVIDRGESGEYASSGDNIPYRLAPDAASGVLRLRRLFQEPGMGVAIGGGIDEVSGVATWSCQPPATAGRTRNDDGSPLDLTLPGTATITFSPAALEPIRGPVTCLVNGEDPAAVVLIGVDGTIPVGPSAVLVHTDMGNLRLALAGPDGMPAGEYQGSLTESRPDLLGGGLSLRAVVDWGPTDPRYVPIGGAGGSRSLSVDIDVTCNLRQANLAGISFGRMDVALASGVNLAWSVEAACSWQLRNGAPVVVQAVNTGTLEFGGQKFRAYARPDFFLLTERGTRYGKLNGSTVDGPVAPDGSNGRLTFTAIGPRGRITNVNGRLGGRGGPLAVDGSLAWSCGDPPAVIPPEAPPT
ncbi:MAG TPA: hypothetical protein VM427_11000 [Patescibacteria group bacterium]|nr:hypothetical protein [Patescibacteria group bacterium]